MDASTSVDLIKARPDATARATLMAVGVGAVIPLLVAIIDAAVDPYDVLVMVCLVGVPIGAFVGGRYAGTVRPLTSSGALRLAARMSGEASFGGVALMASGPMATVVLAAFVLPFVLAIGFGSLVVTFPCAVAWVATMRTLPSRWVAQ